MDRQVLMLRRGNVSGRDVYLHGVLQGAFRSRHNSISFKVAGDAESSSGIVVGSSLFSHNALIF